MQRFTTVGALPSCSFLLQNIWRLFMRKIIIDYVPPVITFLFDIRKMSRKEMIYENNKLGGGISFIA